MKLVDDKQSKKIQEEQKRDVALYFIEDGEDGFNPEWNKMIIERTIKKSDANRRRKFKKYMEDLGERSDAIATYLKSQKVGTPIEKYFSKRELGRLRGEKILDVLKGHYFMGGRKRKLYIPGN